MRGGMRGLGMRGGGERERARAPERDRGGDGYEGGRKEGGGAKTYRVGVSGKGEKGCEMGCERS